MDLDGLDAREVATLSGGERRRLAIATVLAQDPQVFLLDEPIQQLDPQHQLDVLAPLPATRGRWRSVVMTLHDAGLRPGLPIPPCYCWRRSPAAWAMQRSSQRTDYR
jgi:iron complex transport system ATP-binding protein